MECCTLPGSNNLDSIQNNIVMVWKKRMADLNEDERKTITDAQESKSTKQATKYAAKIFRTYLSKKGLNADFENFSKTELTARLRTFYAELRNRDGDMYKRTSFQSLRSGLRRFISQTNDIDIVNDPDFNSANEMFTCVCKEAYKTGQGSIEHRRTIKKYDIKKLYGSVAFNINAPTGLLNKVWFELCMYFCRRGRANLRALTADLFHIATDADGKRYVYKTKSKISKNHQGVSTSEIEDKNVRMYESESTMCPVKSFEKYLSKRNPQCEALFQTPRDSFLDSDPVWFENEPLGKKQLGNKMKDLAHQAQLSYPYTNPCMRVTTITALSRAGFEARHFMTVSGHRNVASDKSYCRDTTTTQKQEMSTVISSLDSRNNEDENRDDDFNGGLSLSQTERKLTDFGNYETIGTGTSTGTFSDKGGNVPPANLLNAVLPVQFDKFRNTQRDEMDVQRSVQIKSKQMKSKQIGKCTSAPIQTSSCLEENEKGECSNTERKGRKIGVVGPDTRDKSTERSFQSRGYIVVRKCVSSYTGRVEAKHMKGFRFQRYVLSPLSTTSKMKIKPLLNHTVLSTPITPTELPVSGSFDIKKMTLCFWMEKKLVNHILHSRDPSFGNFRVQVFVRFCLCASQAPQKDTVPDCILRVNGEVAVFHGKEREHSDMVDITLLCNFKEGEDSEDELSIEWMPFYRKNYSVSVVVAEKLNIPDLVSKWMIDNVKDPSVTKQLVLSKLKSDRDISCTSLKATLICPLGKTRIVSPCRGEYCTHIQCVDAVTLLKLNEGRPLSRRKCYMCDQPAGNIYIDGLFLDILTWVPKSMEEVEFRNDGSWTSADDGSPTREIKPQQSFALTDIKETVSSDEEKIEDGESMSDIEAEDGQIFNHLKSHLSKIKSQVDQLELLSKQHDERNNIVDCTTESGVQRTEDENSAVVDLTEDKDIDESQKEMKSQIEKILCGKKSSSPEPAGELDQEKIEAEIAKMLQQVKGSAPELNKKRKASVKTKKVCNITVAEVAPGDVTNDNCVVILGDMINIYETDNLPKNQEQRNAKPTENNEKVVKLGMNMLHSGLKLYKLDGSLASSSDIGDNLESLCPVVPIKGSETDIPRYAANLEYMNSDEEFRQTLHKEGRSICKIGDHVVILEMTDKNKTESIKLSARDRTHVETKPVHMCTQRARKSAFSSKKQTSRKDRDNKSIDSETNVEKVNDSLNDGTSNSEIGLVYQDTISDQNQDEIVCDESGNDKSPTKKRKKQGPLHSDEQESPYTDRKRPLHIDDRGSPHSESRRPPYSESRRPPYSESHGPPYSESQGPSFSESQGPPLSESQGPLHQIEDSVVPSVARLTLPDCLMLKSVQEDGIEYTGVFANHLIFRETRFGPLIASISLEELKNKSRNAETLAPDSEMETANKSSGKIGLEFKVLGADRRVHVFDVTDETLCNWMIFVRPARDLLEQNLSAYQRDGHVYFFSIKPIHKNTELKVWYSTKYGKFLNKVILPVKFHREDPLEETSRKDHKEEKGREELPNRNALGSNCQSICSPVVPRPTIQSINLTRIPIALQPCVKIARYTPILPRRPLQSTVSTRTAEMPSHLSQKTAVTHNSTVSSYGNLQNTAVTHKLTVPSNGEQNTAVTHKSTVSGYRVQNTAVTHKLTVPSNGEQKTAVTHKSTLSSYGHLQNTAVTHMSTVPSHGLQKTAVTHKSTVPGHGLQKTAVTHNSTVPGHSLQTAAVIFNSTVPSHGLQKTDVIHNSTVPSHGLQKTDVTHNSTVPGHGLQKTVVTVNSTVSGHGLQKTDITHNSTVPGHGLQKIETDITHNSTVPSHGLQKTAVSHNSTVPGHGLQKTALTHSSVVSSQELPQKGPTYTMGQEKGYPANRTVNPVFSKLPGQPAKAIIIASGKQPGTTPLIPAVSPSAPAISFLAPCVTSFAPVPVTPSVPVSALSASRLMPGVSWCNSSTTVYKPKPVTPQQITQRSFTSLPLDPQTESDGVFSWKRRKRKIAKLIDKETELPQEGLEPGSIYRDKHTKSPLMDLAPPTKKLMRTREIGIALNTASRLRNGRWRATIFRYPGRALHSKALLKLFRRNIPADENEADVYMKEQPELHVESKSEKLFQGCSRDPTALIVHGNTAVNEQKVNLKEQQEFHVESKSDRLFQKCDRLFQESFRDPNIVVNSNKDVEFKDVIEINSEEDELTETYDSSKEDAIEIESDCESISLKLTEIPDPIIDIDSDIEMISLDTGNQENMTIEFYSENENSHQNIDHRPKKVFETKTERMASCPNQNKEPKQLNRVATIESDSDDSPQTDASWRNKVCYIEIHGSSQNKHDSQSADAQDNESDLDLGVEVKKHNGPVKTYSRRWPDAGSPSGALNQRLFSKQAKRQYTNSCKVTKAKIPVTVGCGGKDSDTQIDDDRNQALESFIYYMECHGFSVPATARGLLQNETTRTIRRSERNRSEDQAVNKSNHLYQNFFSRYPEISRHLLNRIAVDRQQFPSVTTKKSFLDTILSLYGVKDMPERIYNCAMFSWKDEYSTSAGHGNVEDCQGWSNQLTVTVCVCADGGMMPAIVKVQNSNERCNGLGYLDLQSDLTNIDRYVFLDWFKSHFLTKCTQKKPICLLMDCDGDNLSLPLLEMAIEKNVVVIGLPTEIRQPTHVQVIEPLKAKLERNAATSRDEFISLLKEVLTNVTAASIKEAYQDMYNCPLSQDLKGKKGDNTNLTGKRIVSEEKTKTKKCYTQPSLEPDLRATVYLKRMRELDTNEYKIYA